MFTALGVQSRFAEESCECAGGSAGLTESGEVWRILFPARLFEFETTTAHHLHGLTHIMHAVPTHATLTEVAIWNPDEKTGGIVETDRVVDVSVLRRT